MTEVSGRDVSAVVLAAVSKAVRSGEAVVHAVGIVRPWVIADEVVAALDRLAGHEQPDAAVLMAAGWWCAVNEAGDERWLAPQQGWSSGHTLDSALLEAGRRHG